MKGYAQQAMDQTLDCVSKGSRQRWAHLKRLSRQLGAGQRGARRSVIWLWSGGQPAPNGARCNATAQMQNLINAGGNMQGMQAHRSRFEHIYWGCLHADVSGQQSGYRPGVFDYMMAGQFA